MALVISRNKHDEFNHAFTSACRRAGLYPKLPVTFTNDMPHGFQRYELDLKDGKIVCLSGRRMMTDKDIGL